MKLVVVFASLALANPIQPRWDTPPANTKFIRATSEPCRPVTMLFARGTFEPPPLGIICGPPTATGLQKALGADNITIQGVTYPAAVQSNFLPGGADPKDVKKMQGQIAQILEACPSTKLVVGGYSQGAALTHRALESLPDEQKAKIVAAFTYGDTRNKQDKGRIPNFPVEKTNIICDKGDEVCKGQLIIVPAHLSYGARAGEQVKFLLGKILAS